MLAARWLPKRSGEFDLEIDSPGSYKSRSSAVRYYRTLCKPKTSRPELSSERPINHASMQRRSQTRCEFGL